MTEDAKRRWTVSRTETQLHVTHEHEGTAIAATFPRPASDGQRIAKCSLCHATLPIETSTSP
jgi:hypothetical protein